MKAFEERDVETVNLLMAKHRQVTLEAIRKLQDASTTAKKKTSGRGLRLGPTA